MNRQTHRRTAHAALTIMGAAIALTIGYTKTAHAQACEGATSQGGAVCMTPGAPAEGDEVRFDIMSPDPGKTYSWTVDGSNPVDGASYTTTFSSSRMYAIEAREDGAPLEAFQVTVANRPPNVTELLHPATAVEGAAVNFRVAATDPGADDLTYEWQIGSDTFSGTTLNHTFNDDGTFRVRVKVSDTDGGETEREFSVISTNRPPTIMSTPAESAVQYGEYTYNIGVDDAPGDIAQFQLLDGPEGMRFEGSELRWTPTREQSDEGAFSVLVLVGDGDGGTAVQGWEIAVAKADSDNDGMLDDCETDHGLDPNNGLDAALDGDVDGITNLAECLAGSDPTFYNGPSSPGANRPRTDERVSTSTPEFSVVNAFDPDGEPLAYDFEVYSDAGLTTQVFAASAVPGGEALTRWVPEGALTENTMYWWRARASDAHVSSAWTDAKAFFVDQANEGPLAPTAHFPNGDVDTLRPTFTADATLDPEGDAFIYTFEVATDADFTDPVTYTSPSPEWQVADDLSPGQTYFWRVRADDEFGVSGPYSDVLSFSIIQINTLPSSVAISYPAEGAVLDSAATTIQWGSAQDPDEDAITYQIQVATDQRFSDVVFEDGAVAETSIDVDGLQEDTRYFVRVRANDGTGYGYYTGSYFSINAENAAPARGWSVYPADGSRFAPGSITLTFGYGEDPEGDAIEYRADVYSDEARTELVTSLSASPGAGPTVSADFDAPEVATTYYWTTTVIDAYGAESETSEPWSFIVDVAENLAPKAPLLLGPYSEAAAGTESVELVVANATDPEGDSLSYTFEVYADAEVQTKIWETSVGEGLEGRTLARVDAELEADAVYYWTAFVEDTEGNRSASTEVGSFTVALKASGETTVSSGDSDSCSVASPSKSTTPWIPGAMLLMLVGLGSLRKR